MATAEGYDYLTIKQQDGTITRLPATGVTITFDGENLTATAAGSTTKLALTTLSTMQFTTDEATSVGSVASSAITVRVTGRQLCVSTPEDATVIISNLQGMPLGQYRVGSGSSTVATLKPGLYIIKVNNKTTKIQVR